MNNNNNNLSIQICRTSKKKIQIINIKIFHYINMHKNSQNQQNNIKLKSIPKLSQLNLIKTCNLLKIKSTI